MNFSSAPKIKKELDLLPSTHEIVTLEFTAWLVARSLAKCKANESSLFTGTLGGLEI